MITPYNSVSPVAGGRGQPTGRCWPAGGGPHPAAGPGARFPGGRSFRCEGRGRRARTVAAAAGRESGGGGGAEQGPPSPPSLPPSLSPSLSPSLLSSLPSSYPSILNSSLPPFFPSSFSPFLASSLPPFLPPSFLLPYLPPFFPPSRQWPKVYNLCHTFLHVARVKKPTPRIACELRMAVGFLTRIECENLAQRAKTCDKI